MDDKVIIARIIPDAPQHRPDRAKIIFSDHPKLPEGTECYLFILGDSAKDGYNVLIRPPEKPHAAS